MKFDASKTALIIVLGLVIVIGGYVMYENDRKSHLILEHEQNQLKQELARKDSILVEKQRALEEERRIREIRRIKERVKILNDLIPQVQAELQMQYNKLNDINGFEFMRTHSEKEAQLTAQHKKINNIREQLKMLQDELTKLQNLYYSMGN